MESYEDLHERLRRERLAKLRALSLDDKVNILIEGKRGDDLTCNCGDALDLDCRTIACGAAQCSAYGYLIKHLRAQRAKGDTMPPTEEKT